MGAKSLHMEEVIMSEKILCTGNERNDLAEAFAAEVASKYKSYLEFWRSTAVDDRNEYAMWTARIENEPGVVKERALKRIKSIMDNPQYNRKFYKKIWKVFVDWETIRIVPSTGFYKNLLGRDITNAFSVNVEYCISMRNQRLVQITHSQNVKL